MAKIAKFIVLGAALLAAPYTCAIAPVGALAQAVLDYRASVRAASNSIESAINGCTTLQEFMALFVVPVDENGEPTGAKATINGWPNAL